MRRHLPNDVQEEPEPERARRALWLDLRSWLFLGMGLAGILTVALIVAADEPYAGIDGRRAIRAFVSGSDGDHPNSVRSVPLIGRLVAAIHDLAPVFFAPAGSPDPAAPSNSSAPTSSPIATPAPTPTPTATPSPTPAPNVAITTDRGATAIVALTDLVPGDSLVRTVTVGNAGTLDFRYTVSAAQSASTLLWTDTTGGLQLTVSTAGGAVLYTGPLSGLGSLPGPTILAPGTTETLRYTFDFPGGASNAFQGLLQDLDLVFVAVEFP